MDGVETSMLQKYGAARLCCAVVVHQAGKTSDAVDLLSEQSWSSTGQRTYMDVCLCHSSHDGLNVSCRVSCESRIPSVNDGKGYMLCCLATLPTVLERPWLETG